MDDISPEILINPRLRGVHEQYYRAQWFVQNALVASDLATRFRLLITAIYPARAIVELMLEAAEQQELKPFLDPDSKKSQIPSDLVVSKYSIIPSCPSEKLRLSPKS